jgi:uncharacterized protein YcbK (DUF882 family)
LPRRGIRRNPPTPNRREFRLCLYNIQTNERIDFVYRRGETYLPKASADPGRYLRDVRSGEIHHFDPRLFDLLYDLTASLGHAGRESDVICGYRTPATNELLRTRSAHSGVAVHSPHTLAEAIDVRLPGVPASAVRDAALNPDRGN